MLVVELSQASDKHQNQQVYENVRILSQLQKGRDCKFLKDIFFLIIDAVKDFFVFLLLASNLVRFWIRYLYQLEYLVFLYLLAVSSKKRTFAFLKLTVIFFQLSTRFWIIADNFYIRKVSQEVVQLVGVDEGLAVSYDS